MSHYIEMCSCGAIISQCRCPSPEKEIRITESGCRTCKLLGGKSPERLSNGERDSGRT